MGCVPVDLYVDGSFGEWILDKVSIGEVGHVVTTDAVLGEYGRARGFRTIVGAPHTVNFQPRTIGFSGHYHRVFPPGFLTRYTKMYNLHPGFLPWGRGYYPVFWALWEETPAGATLHEITVGIDEGPIVEQIQVPYTAEDTGETLHERVTETERLLFLRHWPRMVSGELLPCFRQSGEGSYHSKGEFMALKEMPPLSSLSGTELMRLIRAFSFSGYSGLEIHLGDRRYEVTMRALEQAAHSEYR